MPDDAPGECEQDLARIEKTQEALRSYLGADHPDVVALDREIAEARCQLNEARIARQEANHER